METNKELEQNIQEVVDNNEVQESDSSNYDAQQEQPQQEEQVTEKVETEQNSPQKSWKELRQKAEQADKLQRERDEYYNILKQIEKEASDYQNMKNSNKSEPEEEEDFDYNKLDDDEILTAKELKKSRSYENKRIKKLEEQIYNQQARNQEAMIEAELKSKHSDFYDVLTESNIKKLREARPSLAKSINLNPDLKEKAMDTYQAIKDLGITKQDQYSEEKVKAQSNAFKPRSSNSVNPQSGNSPLSKANAFSNTLTKEMKDALYREMLEKSRS